MARAPSRLASQECSLNSNIKEHLMGVVLKEAEIVLAEAGKPLHYREITQRILARGLWKTEGKTPDETVSAQLSVDIINHAQASLFQRTSKGIFALRAWSLPEFNSGVGR